MFIRMRSHITCSQQGLARGTAGGITALVYTPASKRSFQNWKQSIISPITIGIIGVSEVQTLNPSFRNSVRIG